IDKERTGVLVGTGMGGLTVFSNGVQNLIEKGYRKITPFFIPYAITNMGSALLAIDIGFMGPNYSISTACATSNHCFYAAANHFRRGEADLMIADGTKAVINPIGLGGFMDCRALSERNDDPQTASRPWDKNKDGFVMGEGAGVLSMIGHCLGAAGGLEAIATLKAIQTGWLHPTINQIDPEPAVEFNTVANQKQQHEINVGEFLVVFL
ncbi:3-oxoacyl-[acyl-carrier-protein] synthase I, chloroplastic, partial [Tanacetum coccineum]